MTEPQAPMSERAAAIQAAGEQARVEHRAAAQRLHDADHSARLAYRKEDEAIQQRYVLALHEIDMEYPPEAVG